MNFHQLKTIGKAASLGWNLTQYILDHVICSQCGSIAKGYVTDCCSTMVCEKCVIPWQRKVKENGNCMYCAKVLR
jgi:hypothetical protein